MSRLGDTQTFNEDLLSESASESISGTEKRPEAPKVPGIEVSPTKCESGKYLALQRGRVQNNLLQYRKGKCMILEVLWCPNGGCPENRHQVYRIPYASAYFV